MVEINYEALEILMQAKKISRRQLAAQIGVSPDTFAGSFRRKSKMKVEQVWKISDFFNIPPEQLLFTDKEGNYSHADYELVTSRRSDRDTIVESWSIVEITNMLKKMNQDGLNTVQSLVSVLTEVERFRKHPEEFTVYEAESTEKGIIGLKESDY